MTSTVEPGCTTAPLAFGCSTSARVWSIAHGDLTVTVGDVPYAPLTDTASKFFDAVTGLALALADADGLALPEAEVDGAGLALSAGAPSSPHAPRASRTALSPRPTRALLRETRRFRTG